MTIITKAITEKKAVHIMELPLVVKDIPSTEAKDDPEAQFASVPRPTRYVLRCRQRAKRLNSLTTLCLFLTALLVMSIGVIGGVYLYRQYARVQMHRFRGWCDIPYYDSTKASYDSNKAPYLPEALIHNSMTSQDDSASFAQEVTDIQNTISNSFKERFEIDLENEDYEKIDVPDLRGGRQGRYIHDFNTNKTGIIDLDGHRCFVMPLDRERVLPPRSLYDLVNKMYRGYYEVDTEVVRETMRVVTPSISDLSNFGPYIARECRDLPTYKLEKFVRSIDKRSIAGASFGQFAGRKIWELDIMNFDELQAYEERERTIESAK